MRLFFLSFLVFFSLLLLFFLICPIATICLLNTGEKRNENYNYNMHFVDWCFDVGGGCGCVRESVYWLWECVDRHCIIQIQKVSELIWIFCIDGTDHRKKLWFGYQKLMFDRDKRKTVGEKMAHDCAWNGRNFHQKSIAIKNCWERTL